MRDSETFATGIIPSLLHMEVASRDPFLGIDFMNFADCRGKPEIMQLVEKQILNHNLCVPGQFVPPIVGNLAVLHMLQLRKLLKCCFQQNL